MTPEEIQKELKARKLTLAAIGRRARPKTLSRSTIWKNIHQIHGCKSARARRLIAKAIGKTEEEVFGQQAA